MDDASDLLEQAIAEVNRLHPGERFMVKDLFKGYVWKRLDKSVRMALGTLFLYWAKSTDGRVVPVEKTSSKQQVYVIRED